MKKLKYCCELFEIYAKLGKTKEPNIVIDKIEEVYNYPGIKKKYLKTHLRFQLCRMYSIHDITKDLIIALSYCPFCGKDLYKFYKDPAYATEIEGVTYPSSATPPAEHK